MDMSGDKMVYLVLWKIYLVHCAANRFESFPVGVRESSQIGCVHLRVSAESAKILIDYRRIEVGIEA